MAVRRRDRISHRLPADGADERLTHAVRPLRRRGRRIRRTVRLLTPSTRGLPCRALPSVAARTTRCAANLLRVATTSRRRPMRRLRAQSLLCRRWRDFAPLHSVTRRSLTCWSCRLRRDVEKDNIRHFIEFHSADRSTHPIDRQKFLTLSRSTLHEPFQHVTSLVPRGASRIILEEPHHISYLLRDPLA